MIKLKVIQIGNSLGVVLPKEALARLRVDKGDEVVLTDADGGYRLTLNDEGVEDQLELARQIMKKRRIVLKALAQ